MRFIGVLGGKFLHLRQHHFGLVHMLVIEALHDAAMHGVARGEATKRVALHAIFLVNGTRDAVAIHVAADKNGNEIGFFGCHKCSPSKRWFQKACAIYAAWALPSHLKKERTTAGQGSCALLRYQRSAIRKPRFFMLKTLFDGVERQLRQTAANFLGRPEPCRSFRRWQR